ncbi:MAG: ABC transporter ATP-binding protein [Candidatus Aminicenantes bacterium]|nr:ABC transporter ATP-binding protein [Candidatus Aminicenantes bacterium]
MSAVIETSKLSKWYGNVLGLSDVTLTIGPGILGLLGPNGAGKSTFFKLLTGQLKPSIGTVTVFGAPIRNNQRTFRRIGLCPEQDALYEELTGWEFLTNLLRLYGYGRAEIEARAERALETVELLEDRDRIVRGYSRGMRQRLKFAQAVAHDPEVVILDEPLSGLDPLGKRKLIRLIKDFGREGRTVLVSSHVLPEIEALTANIVLVHQGKILASGDIHYIRDLIDTHPHIVAVRSSAARTLAGHFVGEPYVHKVRFENGGELVLFETSNRDRFFERLTRYAADTASGVEEITSPDDNLQAVFDYLVGA